MKKLTFGPYSIDVPEGVTIDKTPTFVGPAKLPQGKLILNLDDKGTQAVIGPPAMQMPGLSMDECSLVFIGSDHPLCDEEPNIMITLPEISKLIQENFKG